MFLHSLRFSIYIHSQTAFIFERYMELEMNHSLHRTSSGTASDHHLPLTNAFKIHSSRQTLYIHSTAAGWGVKGMTVPSAVPNLRDVVHSHQAPCNYARLF